MIKVILNQNVLEITDTDKNSILVVPASDYIVENFYKTNIYDKNLKEKTVILRSKYTNTDYAIFNIHTLDPLSTGYNTDLDVYTQTLSTLLSTSNTGGSGSGSGSGGASSSGIFYINSQTSEYQFLITGNTGNDFNISSISGIHEFNIPTSSATKRGLLDPTYWNIFNNKQNSLFGNGFVKISGSTISYDNSVYLTDINGIAAGGDLGSTYPNPTVSKLNGQTPSFYLDTTNHTEGSNLFHTNQRVIDANLTNYTSTSGVITSSDSIISAIEKIDGNVNLLTDVIIIDSSSLAGLTSYENNRTYLVDDYIYLTTNSAGLFDTYGVGKFYNPRYDQTIAGYNIWDSLNTYNIGDVAFWGGFAWSNVSGNVGSNIGDTLMDAEWTQIPYNEINYKISYDLIKYDITLSQIYYRNEKNTNIIEYSLDYLTSYGNYIELFQFGNVYDPNLLVGVGNQYMNNSYNNNINFKGLYQTNFNFVNYSSQYNVYCDSTSYQSNINFDNSSQYDSIFTNTSSQTDIYFIKSSQNNITFTDGNSQSNLYFTNSSQLNIISGFSQINYYLIGYNNFNRTSNPQTGLEINVKYDNTKLLNYPNFDGISILSQKIGFYDKLAITKPLATLDLGLVLSNLGLRVAGTAYPITTSGVVNLTGNVTLGGSTVTLANNTNFVFNNVNGTKFGTAIGQKIGFFNATPVTQRSNTSDIGVVLSDLGFRAVGSNYQIITGGSINLSSNSISIGTITLGNWNGTPIVDTYISSASIWNSKQAALSGTGLVKSDSGIISYISGTNTDFIKGDGSLDSNSYITGVSITNEASGSGTTSISLTLNNDAVISKLLSGYSSTTGTITSSDSILSAIQKLNGNISLVTGAIVYQGVWNANTNTPTLVSSVGVKGHLYKVSVAGTTNLDGITLWNLGDSVVFNGTTWDKLDGAYNDVLSINGSVGNIVLTGTTNRISVSGLDFDIDSNYVGQTSITTLGTITTGVWNGSTISNTYGGTGTSTVFTEGSILFSGASGIYSQNNSNFYWDNTNIRLGIGTSTPNVSLDIIGDSINITKYSNDAVASFYETKKSRGTSVSPSALLINDNILTISGSGYGTSSFFTDKVSISFGISENWTDTQQGTHITFSTTQIGTTTKSDILKLDKAGLTILDGSNLIFGTTTGTRIGTTTTQKLAFYGSTPVIQQLATTDLGVVLSTLGLRASGTAYTITTSGAVSLSGGLEITTAPLTITNQNIILNSVTGTSIGTSVTQKLAFYGSTPIVQQIDTTDLGIVLSTLGLRATGATYTLTTSGNVSFSKDVSVNHIIGIGAVPTAVINVTGSGATSTVSLSKHSDSSMNITLVKDGNNGGTNTALLTVTFGRAYTAAPKVFLVPVNGSARTLTGNTLVYVPETSITTSGFSIFSGPTRINNSLTYKWSAFIIQ